MYKDGLMSGTEESCDALADRISYAQSWEDPIVLQRGLGVGTDDDVLSICGAGDTSFALAIAGARSVTVIGLSAPQIALAKLKLVAAQHLDLERFRSFLGVGPIGQRIFLYHELRVHLDDQTRAFWDGREAWIREGILGCGEFEKYLSTFRTRLLPLVHRRRTIEGLMAAKSLDEQRSYFDKKWNGWRWRALFRVFFSQMVMQRLGRSGVQFAHVEGPVSTAFMARAEHALTELSAAENPFLQWMLLGAYTDLENSQPYLSQSGHAALAEAAARIHFVHDDLMGHLRRCAPGTYSAFNLSDVPEYLGEAETEALLRACVSASGTGARLAYWNLLVPRHRPESMADQLDRDEELAARLLRSDRAFVYGGFHVETVR
jgi:S-adenosylmethionine-diacylglycerol 3-amino-3-carboxypropyl transferase